MPETTRDRCITPSFSPSTYHRRKLMDGEGTKRWSHTTRNTPIWQFSMRPAVPLYWRATPADFVPFFRKPVSSTISTASRSANTSTTYPRHRSRAAASSHCTCESSRCVRHGRASPRCSASCQPFLRSTALSRPSRYSPACRRGSERTNSSPKRACNSLSSDRQLGTLASLTRRLAAIQHRSQRCSPQVRKINCSNYRDIGARFIVANSHPDHDTIATFRRTNKAAFEAAFLEVLLLARETGILEILWAGGERQ